MRATCAAGGDAWVMHDVLHACLSSPPIAAAVPFCVFITPSCVDPRERITCAAGAAASFSTGAHSSLQELARVLGLCQTILHTYTTAQRDPLSATHKLSPCRSGAAGPPALRIVPLRCALRC